MQKHLHFSSERIVLIQKSCFVWDSKENVLQMLLQNNDIQALLTTHFNITVWKHSRGTYFCRYRFKTSFEAFFQQSQIYWRENLPLSHLPFFPVPLIQVILEMYLAEYSSHLQHAICLLVTCTESYLIVGIQLM